MYVVLWEFRTRDDVSEAFEAAYSSRGSWARLFSRDPNFLGTELLRDSERYVTVDRWKSEADYGAFRAAFHDEYETLDRSCEKLTVSERFLGAFTLVD